MTLKQFTETDQQAIAEGIARALDLEGLLVQTINGSDRPRQQSAELIARQLRDLHIEVKAAVKKEPPPGAAAG